MTKPWEQEYDVPASAPWEADYDVRPVAQAPQKPLRTPMQAATDSVKQSLTDLAAGAVRGAGSIGATVVAPADMLVDAVKGDRKMTTADLITGKVPMTRNQERRAKMDAGLKSLVGADTESGLYQTGKIGTEIAGTLGVGGAVGNTLLRVAPKAAPIAQAIASGGMRTGSVLDKATKVQKAADMATRIAGGAVGGAAATGLVDPSMAGTGALVGGAIPPLAKGFGAAGQAARQVISGPAVPEATRKAVESARQAGYVIPPTQARPTLVNRALEGTAGKLTTAQNASAANQAITDRAAARALGLADDAKVTPEALAGIRKQAGASYQAVADTGLVRPQKSYSDALDKITEPFRKAAAGFPNAKANPVIADIESLKSPEFDASSAIEKISLLRDEADTAYAAGNKAAGKAYKSAAGALEDALEGHLRDIQAPAQLLTDFRNARQLIAKTYSVQKALANTEGTVDARKLAAQLLRGKPLSGDLLTAARFAEKFPKAAQPPEKMGSLPGVSPLDMAASTGVSAVMANPLYMAGLLTRPAARAAALSPIVQNRLAKQQGGGLLSMFDRDPATAAALARSIPVAASGR